MKKPHKRVNRRKGLRFFRNRNLLLIAAVLLLVLVILLLLIPQLESKLNNEQATLPETSTETGLTPVDPGQNSTPSEQPQETEPTVPIETEPQILPYLSEMAAENEDMVGWIKIEDTKLNYPLMFTPDFDEEYIHKGFDGNFSVSGLPFIEGQCSLEPRSDNLIIYGHNMKNGSMFSAIMDYDEESFWKDHPVIHLSTLYEEKPYEVFAAFYDRVYYKHETCFKFYQFVDAVDEEDFNNAINEFKKKSCYDTGITPVYGDQLVTLVTCSYHEDNGRFVVVARAAADDATMNVTANS